MKPLNKEQILAVEHINGPCIVTATPGSGKTHTLTSRVIHLVKSNISPSNILCLTFTNRAAEEMRSRIAHRLGQQSDKVWVGTFHRLCIAILRKYGSLINLRPNFSIYDEKDQIELIKKIARMQDYDKYSYGDMRFLATVANDFREDIIDFEEHVKSLTPLQSSIVQEYLETLDELNSVDFSGILYKCYLILSNHNDIAEKLSNKFKHVLVDEGQDTNTIQYEIIKSIAKHGNLFVVADVNQSIFAFRGACPENINKIKSDFTDVKQIILPRNYRSTSRILLAAQTLIRHNKDAHGLELISERGDGENVQINSHWLPEDEATYIANVIQNFKSAGYKYSDCAVLYRLNRHSQVIEMTMRHFDVPYRIFGGFSFFDRAEVKTTLSYLSFLSNPYDSIAFERAISNPKRNIGKSTIGKLERFCQDRKLSIIEACEQSEIMDTLPSKARVGIKEFVHIFEDAFAACIRGDKLSAILSKLVRGTGYYKFLENESEKDPSHQRRLDNVDELILGLSKFEEDKPGSTITDYLHSVQTMSSDTGNDDDDAVSLMTMHSAKGLEFKAVFIVAVEHGIIPHSRAVQENGEDEERRLFYVAMTRAKDYLFINRCRRRKRFMSASNRSVEYASKPSCFIDEINCDAEG